MAVAAIALLHVVLVLALLRSAQAPDTRHEAPAVATVAFAFIAAPASPVPEEKSAPPPIAAPRLRPRHAIVVAREVAPQPALTIIVQESPPGSEAPPPPAQAREQEEGRLDMDSLRAAARQVDSERSPEARRASAQLRGMDDTALSRAVQRAKLPDCQTKYAGGEKVNLLLLVPLAIDTITGKGCRW